MSILIAFALAASQPAVLTLPPSASITARGEEAKITAAITDVYAVISGPAGQKRDFARMKTLFTPDARLYAVGQRGLQGGSLDEYISRSGPMLEKVGFTERELANRVQMYGNVAQVWSSYHGTSTDGTVNIRGINSFQLARQPDGSWLVHSILWQQERPDIKLPADMEVR